jgi:hypothetical protein
MGRVLIKIYDKNNNEIFFGRDLHTARFVGIIFQGCSYIVVSNFLNIIKNKYMCEKISTAVISEILESFGCECLGLDHLDGYSEFKKIPFEIEGVMVTQDDAYQCKICLNIIISDWQKYCFNDCLHNLDVSSMYPADSLYYTHARGSGKSQATKSMLNNIYGLNEGTKDIIHSVLNEQKEGENMIRHLPNPKRVICSGPVTTVIYKDGSKTHVRKTEDDENDYEKAFLLSWLYKTYGKSVVEKKLKEFSSEFVEPEEPAYMGAVAETLNHVLKMSIGKKK